MAKTVIINPYFELATDPKTGQVAKLEIKQSFADQNVTNDDSGGFSEDIPGLGQGTVAIDWVFNDDGVLQGVLYDFHMARQPVAFVARQSASAVSSSNPQYAGFIYINEIVPIMGAPGDAKKQSVTYKTKGAISRTTS